MKGVIVAAWLVASAWLTMLAMLTREAQLRAVYRIPWSDSEIERWAVRAADAELAEEDSLWRVSPGFRASWVANRHSMRVHVPGFPSPPDLPAEAPWVRVPGDLRKNVLARANAVDARERNLRFDRDRVLEELGFLDRAAFAPVNPLPLRILTAYPTTAVAILVILAMLSPAWLLVEHVRRKRSRPPPDDHWLWSPPRPTAPTAPRQGRGQPPVVQEGSVLENLTARARTAIHAETQRVYLREHRATFDEYAATAGAHARAIEAVGQATNAPLRVAIDAATLRRELARALGTEDEHELEEHARWLREMLQFIEKRGVAYGTLATAAEHFTTRFGPQIGAALFEALLKDFRDFGPRFGKGRTL